MANDRSVLDLPIKISATDNDSVIAVINNQASRIKFSILKSIFGQWSNINNKPFETMNSTHFVVSNSELSLSNNISTKIHSHTNRECLNKLSEDSDGNLLYDGEIVGSSWGELSDDFEIIDDELCLSSTIKDDLHTHTNKTVIDKFSEVEGQLLYNGSEIGGSGLDFSALANAMTTGTLTGLTITADTTNENFDITVTGMPTIAIDNNGYWTIDGVSTGQQSQGVSGSDGLTPTIDPTTKHWMIGATDTNVVAEGQDGNNGITPSIDNESKHWIIGSTDTNVVAEGIDGVSPAISFTTITGGNRMTVVDGSGTSTIDIMDGVTTVTTSKVDLTCTALATNWSGASAPYTQTITVNGLTSSLNPVIDVVISNTVETGLEEQKQWGYITKATTGTNTLTLSCYKDKPTIDLNIMIEVV